jgi:hypothetical protein
MVFSSLHACLTTSAGFGQRPKVWLSRYILPIDLRENPTINSRDHPQATPTARLP